MFHVLENLRTIFSVFCSVWRRFSFVTRNFVFSYLIRTTVKCALQLEDDLYSLWVSSFSVLLWMTSVELHHISASENLDQNLSLWLECEVTAVLQKVCLTLSGLALHIWVPEVLSLRYNDFVLAVFISYSLSHFSTMMYLC